MLILGIESSCDETAAAVVSGGRKIVSNTVSSQVNIHSPYYGVVPELASRAHLENINAVIGISLKRAGIGFNNLSNKVSAIAFTRGPGLAGPLLVGNIAAKTLSYLTGVPLVGINHLEGHLYAALLENRSLVPPYISLIVSGGHTELIIVKDFGNYRYLGGTRDDAAGEAFDKVARLLKLRYPGGPEIDNLSKKGDPESFRFPRPYLWESWDFSFSGLKTAVVNRLNDIRQKKLKTADICASFQSAVVETLVEKTVAAAKKFRMKNIVVGGGVAANSGLRQALQERCHKEGLNAYLPSINLCTDNAAMIACAGYYKFMKSGGDKIDSPDVKPDPALRLRNWIKNKRF